MSDGDIFLERCLSIYILFRNICHDAQNLHFELGEASAFPVCVVFFQTAIESFQSIIGIWNTEVCPKIPIVVLIKPVTSEILREVWLIFFPLLHKQFGSSFGNFLRIRIFQAGNIVFDRRFVSNILET